MRFFVHTWRKSTQQQPLTAHLTPSSWNDYNFVTLHYLVVVDAKGEAHKIGQVKIGEVGQQPDTVLTNLPTKFEYLPERFFSLGQNDSFYSSLQELGNELNSLILSALNDVAYSQESYARAVNERVTQRSLLRDVSPLTVEGQFRRLAYGGQRLSRYQFAYQLPNSGGRTGQPPVTLSFDILPSSNPPTNVHVVIGRNGVGKTHLLQGMTQALVGEASQANEAGIFFNQEVQEAQQPLFANVVSVTFSAFDPFSPLPEGYIETAGLRYAYVGLKQPPAADGGMASLKSYQDLQDEFASSLRACYRKARLDRLQRAVAVLATDPVFRDNGIRELLTQADTSLDTIATSSEEWPASRKAAKWFSRLSSGHKIVLLTIVRLIETVEERTLVVLDEPEAHLHPPLLAAFVRALSNLLVNRNGVAIIATHSPVVLQEVPKNCVWKLRRHGTVLVAERPEMETFGENVGILTREAFGLEVTEAGFHQLLREAVREQGSYAAVIEQFSGQLGMEAKALVRALIITERNQ